MRVQEERMFWRSMKVFEEAISGAHRMLAMVGDDLAKDAAARLLPPLRRLVAHLQEKAEMRQKEDRS